MIEATANDFTHHNIYLNNSLLFSHQLIDFINGSIGFRARKAPTFYYNLNYSSASIPMVPGPNSTNIASLVVSQFYVPSYHSLECCFWFFYVLIF